jgi:hypothetical protein
MGIARSLASLVCAGFLAALPAAASHLVTGNGFGFAVVSPETGTVTKFYAHPYSFVRPDSLKPLSEGVETANFIQETHQQSTRTTRRSSAFAEAMAKVFALCRSVCDRQLSS